MTSRIATFPTSRSAAAQFALATRGSDDVLAQSSSNGLAIAVLSDSDWTDDQRVEADITPTFSGTGSWVGLVARYVDADNYYYVAIRDNQTYGIYKRVNGVDDAAVRKLFLQHPDPDFPGDAARRLAIRSAWTSASSRAPP